MQKIEDRADQTEVVAQICDAFNNGKEIVVLSAPTGWGKSILAWRVAHDLGFTAAVLSHQKILQDQYHDTFWNKDPNAFTTLKGKSNYFCKIRKDTPVALAPCSFSKNYSCRYKADLTCPYHRAKSDAEGSHFLNTNYQYVWNMADMQNDFSFGKDLYVYDEAHVLHSLYTDHRSPNVTSADLKFYKKERDFAIENKISELEHYSDSLINELESIDLTKSNDDEYLFEKMKSIFTLKMKNSSFISKYIEKNLDDLCETGKISVLGALDRIECRSKTTYKLVTEKRPNFENCVIELNSDKENNFTLKLTPFDIGKLFAAESLLYSEKKLFMSATLIDPIQYLKRLGFRTYDAEIIELDSKFPLEHRPVYVAPKSQVKMNYNTIKNEPSKITPFLELTKELVTTYAANGHSGVIFTSSYEITNMVSNYFKMHLPENAVEIFYNMDTSQRDDALNGFKTKGSLPHLLISCSFYEGINLNDDLSRYNIIFKMPYKSLASKYVKAVMEKDPVLYATWCINDIVQAAGRSVRSEEDWADTYIIDPAFRGALYWNRNLFPHWFKKAIQYI